MTAPAEPPPARRSGPMKRYGPVVAVLVAIALVAVLASVGSADRTTSTGGPTVNGVATGDPTANPDLPITYNEAVQSGKGDSYSFKDCDPVTGRIKVPSIYAPPCVAAVNDHGKGRATTSGVTGDTIKVVFYLPPKDDQIAKLLATFLDPQDVQDRTRDKFVEYFNHSYEMWGRQVKLVPYQATGQSDDVEAARADALKVVDLHPFASIGGPNLTPAYGDELAKNHILCFVCGLALPDSSFQENAPYSWGPLPTPEQFIVNVGDYIAGRLNNRKASFGGPAVKDRMRRFGVVHFEQNPPVFSAVKAVIEKEGRKRGFVAADTEVYNLDLAKLPERAATIIAKLKAADVTTVIFLGDPIMPIYLTKEATKQNFFPEWVVTGTFLTDSTTLGRAYDPEQWQHAFGLSNLAVRTPLEQQEGYRLYQWYFGQPPEAAKTQALLYQALGTLFLGIHMAGPNLTPQTFQGGLFKYPPSGGGSTTPQISFGKHGYFVHPDYLGVDDSTEIWWDKDAVGPNEQGVVGKGMWRYVDGGKRYLPGRMPRTPPRAFIPDGSVTGYDTPPPEDQYPDPTKYQPRKEVHR